MAAENVPVRWSRAPDPDDQLSNVYPREDLKKYIDQFEVAH